MTLRDRLRGAATGFATPAEDLEPAAPSSRAYQGIKAQIHQLLLQRIDLEAMESLSPERLKDELRQMVERLLQPGKGPVQHRVLRRVDAAPIQGRHQVAHQLVILGSRTHAAASAEGGGDASAPGPSFCAKERQVSRTTRRTLRAP